MSDAKALHLRLHCDGASRGNPGPAAVGAVLTDVASGESLAEISEAIGAATNNEAEYESLRLGLEKALALAKARGLPARIDIFMDSELVIRQLLGRYKVKNERLKPRFAAVRELLAAFESWSADHVRREFNKEADALANKAFV